jgi:transcription initiation factor TFIID subunit 1
MDNMEVDDDLFGEFEEQAPQETQPPQEQPTQEDADDNDDDEIGKLLAGATDASGKPQGLDSLLDEIGSRPLDIGEKADDAIDYEDISDNDLPPDEDEEPASGATNEDDLGNSMLNDLMAEGEEHDDDLDAELFGGGSSPVQERFKQEPGAADAHRPGETGHKADTGSRPAIFPPPKEGEEADAEYLMQKALFDAAAGRTGEVPPPPQTSKEYFDRIWPDFEPDKPPRFYSLLPRKRAFFVPRTPLKPPKPLQMNKVSLDLAVDQEKSFRLPSTSATTNKGRQLEEEQRGIIFIAEEKEKKVEDEDKMDFVPIMDLNDEEPIGNVSWSDMKIACEDWDRFLECSSDEEEEPVTPPDALMDGNDWIRDALSRPTKKRKLPHNSLEVQFSVYDHVDFPGWEDPELATSEIAKKITLDMNDPHLLLDVQQGGEEAAKKPRQTALGVKRDNRGSLANPMFRRYNISNDEAYDALKENNQQKVRSTLGHMNIEHSLPALKLQYPFYKVNLSDRELRQFHRPTMDFKVGERAAIEPFRKDVKRKHKKNLKPSEAFATSEDLNIGDTSDLLLAEYSEEYPTTLSNHGMGNKIVNYYRRKDNEDTSRPKLDLGETMVLLPQDKSPFSIFGTVNPGETVPTLLNAMYRAPVFQHKPKQTDFLVSRSKTGIKGSHYYMRNIQNLVVVGQQFPSVEVPGTHARKVTEASKKRLKMLAFRLYRKGQQRGARQPWVSNEMIKHHLPGTEIAQNRSRMREIMKYEKETGTWRPQDGETIPDEPSLRTWIKPEDICLIDSMHAGDRHLTDAGFKANEIKDDEDGEDGENIELKLAPWHTTKNFLNACQGKAMLELHGPGDPTARGEAFSFIKVSMKGGFKDVGESVGDKLDAKKVKELGGHSYNVAQQQKRYEDAIQRIWNKQTESLSSTLEHSDVEMDNVVDHRQQSIRGRTPRSEFGTPALMRDDDTMSQFSRNSGADIRGKKLRIRRKYRNEQGEVEERTEIITDPEVIKLYTRRKKQEQLESMRIEDMKATGVAEFDAQQRAKSVLPHLILRLVNITNVFCRLEAELARLKRNVERREGREKAKGIHNVQSSVPGTPGAVANSGKGAGATPRKCANCGEVGHIKTNKKCVPGLLSFSPLIPMLVWALTDF